jgi:uncharacterized membrane protein YbhN (UPF0104 family)
MPVRKALILYGFMALCYVVTLVFLDKRQGFTNYIPRALSQLPVIMALALCACTIRFIRWRLLQRWQGNSYSFVRGGLAYFAGFAFTATPGKVGELVRIRYFSRLAVPHHHTFSTFVFERTLDLIVVFFLACFAIPDRDIFVIALVFVSIFLLIVAALMVWPTVLSFFALWCGSKDLIKFRDFFNLCATSMGGCRVWLKPIPLLVSFFLGFLAWSLTSLAFVYLLCSLSIDIPTALAFAIYPTAMLAGAASMMPGGVGSTELAIALLLGAQGVSMDLTVLAAVIVRIGTLWLLVFVGLLAIVMQELLFTSTQHKNRHA